MFNLPNECVKFAATLSEDQREGVRGIVKEVTRAKRGDLALMTLLLIANMQFETPQAKGGLVESDLDD